MKIEIITTNIEEAMKLDGNTNRVELVKDFAKGGLTPDVSVIEQYEAVEADVSVMLRETSETFVYDDEMFQKHVDKLNEIINWDFENIVFGSLNPDKTINIKQLKVIADIVHANEKRLTFHRAFDEVEDHIKAAAQLNGYVDYLLTSGTESTAEVGLEKIKEIIKTADYSVIPGAGINKLNISLFKDLDVEYLHIGTGARDPETIDGKVSNFKIAELKKQID